jgi:predicted esterase
MRVSRRSFFVAALAGALPRAVRADDEPTLPLEVRPLALEHETLLALPRDRAAVVPLVVLLHGLGETGDPHLGARAWIDRYGLGTSVARLKAPPLTRLGASARDDWGDALPSLNASLAGRPYRGLAFVCPHVPRMPASRLDAYTRWIVETLIPRARAEAGPSLDPSPARLAGCSYGGWVSLEALLRAPDAFAAWAGIQTAISAAAAPTYADRLARLSPRPLLLETSRLDPFHDAGVALAHALDARHIPCDLRVLPGPHDQPWLREAGTPTALAWLDRTSP